MRKFYKFYKFYICQSLNGGLWTPTYRRDLTALEAAAQLAAIVEGEAELRKTQPGEAKYQIRPERG